MDVFRTVDSLYVMRLTVGGNLIDFSPINDRDACGDNFSRWNMYGRDPRKEVVPKNLQIKNDHV